MIYPRIVERKIDRLLFNREILILYGPRRVGKTTLLKKYLEKLSISGKTAYFSMDDPSAEAIFTDFSGEKLKTIFKSLGFSNEQKNYLFIDEAVSFKNVDLLLKLIYDEFPWIKVMVSSSSSLLLLENLTESLAGRKYFIELFPLTIAEILQIGDIDYFSFNEDPILQSKTDGEVSLVSV